MHTLEVDICILKTCLEVIICRPTIIILLSKLKYKMYASMYIIVHKIYFKSSNPIINFLFCLVI